MANAAKKPVTWVLVADEAIAHIFLKPLHGDLEDVDHLADPAAHAKSADTFTDSDGRRSAGDTTTGGSSMSSAGDSEQHLEGARFAARVAAHLTQALQKKSFDKLHVVAAPRFLGQLRKAFSPQVSATIVEELAKDLSHATAHELTQRLFPPVEKTATR